MFLVVCIVIAFVVFQVIFFGWFLIRSHDTDVARDQAVEKAQCIAKINGTAQSWAFVALAAPPAPNPQRLNAVKHGLVAAHELQHPDRYC